MNANLLQPTRSQQRMLIRCGQLDFGSESQIHYRTKILAANSDSLHTTQFQQQITNLLKTTHTLSAANADSLQTTPFQQRMLIRCQHNFGSEC